MIVLFQLYWVWLIRNRGIKRIFSTRDKQKINGYPNTHPYLRRYPYPIPFPKPNLNPHQKADPSHNPTITLTLTLTLT